MSPPEGFTLEPDRGQIARFVEGAFRHVEEGGIISLRAFYDDELAKKRNDRPFDIVAVKLNGRGHEPIVEAAFALALEAAKPKRPVVVAPPIATFRTSKADEKNLLEGPLLSLELDERAAEAVAKLRAILGPPTFVVASGGEWLDPETGEVEPKLHAHWRLKEPAVGEEEHRRLKRLRTLACELVEGDGTSKTTVHPMRWPGTLHRKNPDRPRLACLIEENADAEIVLDDALGELEGIESLRRETANRDGPRTSGDDPTCRGSGGTTSGWHSGVPAAGARAGSQRSTTSLARAPSTTRRRPVPGGTTSPPRRRTGSASAPWYGRRAGQTLTSVSARAPSCRRTVPSQAPSGNGLPRAPHPGTTGRPNSRPRSTR
jgi:hypothetical protein